jgi:protein-L-isoaspartate(D-aspartate) O-methyltransferase
VRAAARARSALVDALRAAGRVRSPAIEAAFRAVPRHLFLPDEPLRRAYADEAVAVQFADGVATSSASQPSMMAIMLEQLDLRPGHRVLEIGAGTGYNAALMSHVVGPTGVITAIDIDAELIARAGRHLDAAGVTGIVLVSGDGAEGYPPGAPYDRVVLTVGSADVRPEWVAQLAPEGKLLLPLTVRGSQLSVALTLGADGVLRSDSVRSCAFIRLRGIGAGPETTMPLARPGLSVQPAGDDPVDPALVDAALDDPGPVVGADGVLGPADLWDGFGLYLALTTPGACRLLANGDGHSPRELTPMGPGLGTLALAGRDGLAAVVADGPEAEGRSRGTGIRAFGPRGGDRARELAAALQRWLTVGRPQAAGLRLHVMPGTRPVVQLVTPGAAVVTTEHCRIVAGWGSAA